MKKIYFRVLLITFLFNTVHSFSKEIVTIPVNTNENSNVISLLPLPFDTLFTSSFLDAFNRGMSISMECDVGLDFQSGKPILLLAIDDGVNSHHSHSNFIGIVKASINNSTVFSNVEYFDITAFSFSGSIINTLI